MSLQHVTKAIEAFLSDGTPEVLCISGRWGTGKTYNWHQQTKRLREKKGAIKLGEYAYVSLFGLNSIAEIKTAILQSTSPRIEIGDFISNEKLRARLNTGEKLLKRLVGTFLPSLVGDTLGDAIVSALSVMISEQIVCFDDLERKGSELNIGDVLGYISHLKEDRRCKVVILLNEEAFQSDDDKQFRSYLEKVVDKSLLFEPTPDECASIAITERTPTADFVRERVSALGIDNVRVIRKIYELVKQIEPLLSQFEPSVFKNAASSIALLGWSHFQPDIAPTWKYLEEKDATFGGLRKKDEPTDQEREWDELLNKYGYRNTDLFDRALMKSIRAGYFDESIVDEHATLLHSQAVREKAEHEWRGVMDGYYYSFKAMEDEAMGKIVACFVKNVAQYRLAHLNTLCNILKQLNRDADFKTVTNAYFAVKKGNAASFNVAEAYMREEVHPDLQALLDAELKNYSPSTSFEQALDDLYQSSMNSRLIGIIAQGSVDDFYTVLKTYEGDRFSMAINGLRELLRFGEPTPEMITILDRVGEAFRKIAAESNFNTVRTRGWGFIERMDKREAEQAAAAASPA